jgi:hypothetical protein
VEDRFATIDGTLVIRQGSEHDLLNRLPLPLATIPITIREATITSTAAVVAAMMVVGITNQRGTVVWSMMPSDKDDKLGQNQVHVLKVVRSYYEAMNIPDVFLGNIADQY